MKYGQLIDSDTIYTYIIYTSGINYYMLNPTTITTNNDITEQYTFYELG